MQIAASPDLIRGGLRIAWDEMVHARMSHRTYVAAGGEQAPELVRERLALMRSEEPLEHDVTRVAVNTFCIGETVAVPLFAADRAWGLMPPAEYAAVVEKTLTRDWIPRFGKVGIDARAAWDESRRLAPTG